MKTHSLLSALVISSLLSFGINTWAHDGHDGDGQGDDNDDQGENCQGGHIDGSETLIATVVLVATNNAPTNSGGFAKLISENEDGVVSSSFSLCITGLTTGTYDLSVIRKSDGSLVDLGQFSVGCHHHGDGDDNDDENDDGEKCCQLGVSLDDVPLPSDLDPMDIAQIVISDSDGNVILIGDLVDPVAASSIKFRAHLRIRSASGIASKNNKALAFTNAKKGKRADRFTMIASGVAPNTTFSVSVNGRSAGTVTSNAKGKVLVRTLPANLLVVKSVRLIDSTGATSVRAKF
jgi:hypothetical protein